MLPAILGGLIISFLEAIALFGAPALIALPARFHVVSTQLWQFFEYPVRVELAAAYAMPLLLITRAACSGCSAACSAGAAIPRSAARAASGACIRLGPWRWVMLGYALFVCALSVFLPMIVLLQAAFAKAWGRGFSLDNLTLHNFHYILFEQTQAQKAIVNTFVYSGITAFAAIGLVARHRLCGEPQAGAVEQRARVPVHGAVRHPRHRAGDRLLRRLRAAAARALRHRARS